MSEPLLDLVIAVHSTERPIRRAVASVLDADDERLRVTVVCHELPVERIGALLDGLLGDRVRLLAFSDGVRSPAGPMNAGLAAATAEYVAVMGSDDFFEPGATAAYLDAVEREHPDVLIVPLRHQDGGLLRNPLVRWRRRRRLDAVRDRLFYRSSPLALIRRSLLAARAEPFLTGLPTGEDLDFSTWLWTRSIRIDFPVDAPAYVIGDDAEDRISFAPLPAAVVLEPLRRVLAADWVATLPAATRRALGVKLLRIHVLGAVRSRRDASFWSDADAAALVDVSRAAVALASDVLGPFALADRRILEAILGSGGGIARALDAVDAAERASWRERTLPKSILRSLDRESTLTRYLLYRLDRRGAA